VPSIFPHGVAGDGLLDLAPLSLSAAAPDLLAPGRRGPALTDRTNWLCWTYPRSSHEKHRALLVICAMRLHRCDGADVSNTAGRAATAGAAVGVQRSGPAGKVQRERPPPPRASSTARRPP